MKNLKNKIKEYLHIFGVFFKIGAVTFGGGLAMLPILETELTEKRNWTNKEQLLDYYAIGQSTPGIIAVNVATFIGYNRLGILGGIIATAGVVTPSIIIISILAKFISNFSEILWVQKALAGINVAVAALLTKAVWQFCRKSVKNIWGVLILISSFAVIFFLKLSSVLVIITSALIGILIFLAENRKNKKSQGEEK